MKISGSGSCTQEMICGGEVRILLINFGPLRCLMSTGLEHSGECNRRRLIEEVNEMIGDTYLILDVEMELL